MNDEFSLGRNAMEETQSVESSDRQLRVAADMLGGYGTRPYTRTDLNEVMAYLDVGAERAHLVDAHGILLPPQARHPQPADRRASSGRTREKAERRTMRSRTAIRGGDPHPVPSCGANAFLRDVFVRK
jgi:hypothetical protein